MTPRGCAACPTKIPRDRAHGKTAGLLKNLQKNTARVRANETYGGRIGLGPRREEGGKGIRNLNRKETRIRMNLMG